MINGVANGEIKQASDINSCTVSGSGKVPGTEVFPQADESYNNYDNTAEPIVVDLSRENTTNVRKYKVPETIKSYWGIANSICPKSCADCAYSGDKFRLKCRNKILEEIVRLNPELGLRIDGSDEQGSVKVVGNFNANTPIILPESVEFGNVTINLSFPEDWEILTDSENNTNKVANANITEENGPVNNTTVADETRSVSSEQTVDQTISPSTATEADVINQIIKILGADKTAENLTVLDFQRARDLFNNDKTQWKNLGIQSFRVDANNGIVNIELANGTKIHKEFKTSQVRTPDSKTARKTAAQPAQTPKTPEETVMNKIYQILGKRKKEEITVQDLKQIRTKNMNDLKTLGVSKISIDEESGVANIYMQNGNKIHFDFPKTTQTPPAKTTTKTNKPEQQVAQTKDSSPSNATVDAEKTRLLNKICSLTGKTNIEDLTLTDIGKARRDFEENKADWNAFGVVSFAWDPDAGAATITLTNGVKIRLDYDPEEAQLEPYIKDIRKLAKSTSYSEDLISSIVLCENFTPVPEYKPKEKLWEYGFGHTTKVKPPEGFRISIEDAMKLLGDDIKERENQIRSFGEYYRYDTLPKPLQEAMIDVSYNRGIGRLNPHSKSFDKNYRSVHANIKDGAYEYAALRLRQEKFPVHESGVRKRNVTRFLNVLDDMISNKLITPKEVVNVMNKFESDGNYYTKTLRLQGSKGAQLKNRWETMYNNAKRAM